MSSLTTAEAQKRIQWLSEEIASHNKLYHGGDKPQITDQEFDNLSKELNHLKDLFPSLSVTEKGVGHAPSSKFRKITHAKPMLSLNNAFSIQDIAEFIARVEKLTNASEKVELFCEPKIDGLSFSAFYKGGKLVYGATRGDGTTGEDITANLKEVRGIPDSINYFEEIEIRGEVYMTKDAFISLNQRRAEGGEDLFANPRNAAAGSLRHLNHEITRQRNLSYFAWGGAIKGIHSQQEMMAKLKELGFITTEGAAVCKTTDEIQAYHDNFASKRASLNYDIDGLVYKVNSIEFQQQMGEVSRAPRWAIAHKFPSEIAITNIEDIIVQVGRTGALTPVAILTPVNVGGVLVMRATLHNEDEIQRKDFRVGDSVTIRRSGDVIPQILSVDISKRSAESFPYSLPKECPVCKSPVLKDQGEAVSRCIGGMGCEAQVVEGIKHFVSKKAFNIVGLGDRQIEEFYKEGRIKNVADIFRLNVKNGVGFKPLEKNIGWGKKSVSNLFESIENSKKVSLAKFIFSLGIRYVGEVTSEYLAKHYKNIDEFVNLADKNNAEEELQSIEGIGDVVASSIAQFLANDDNMSLIVDTAQFLDVEEEKTAQNNESGSVFYEKKIIFTGTLESMSRFDAEDAVKKLGAKVVKSISKKTDYLIVGKDPGSKLEKANKLGINVLSEQEWLAKLN